MPFHQYQAPPSSRIFSQTMTRAFITSPFCCNDIPFEERLEGFKRRGFSNIQSGSWLGANHFVFFGTESETSTVL